jgi:hypothetical protein
MHEAAHLIDISCREFHNKANQICFTIFGAPWHEILILQTHHKIWERLKQKNN